MSTCTTPVNGVHRPSGPSVGELLDAMPPNDPIAEQGVLGCVILNPSLLDSHDVRRDHFYSRTNRIIFGHLEVMRDRGIPIDAKHLVASLRESGDYESIGGAAELAEVLNGSTIPTRFGEYLTTLQDDTARRSLLASAIETIQAVHSRTATDDVLAAASQSLADARESRGCRARPISLEKLIADNPKLSEPLIDGLLRRGETANVIAPPKAGKSWLVLGLALSMATGDAWLGRFQCRKGRVLLIDNELHPSTLANRITAVAQAMELQPGEYKGQIKVHSLRGKLDDLHGIADLLYDVRPGTFDVVVLDAFYRALPKGESENDNATIAGLFNLIDSITARQRCAWINIHHTNKGSQGDKSVTDVGAGAGAQSRAADAHLVLRPHEVDEAIVLEAVVRSFAPVAPLPLRWTFPIWSADGSLDPAKVRGRGNKFEEQRSERDRKDFDAITSALRSRGPLTHRTLRGIINAGKERTDRLLDALEAVDAIESHEVLARGGKQKTYTLKETGP